MIDFSVSMPAMKIEEIEDSLDILSASGFYYVNVSEFLCSELLAASESTLASFRRNLQLRSMNIDWIHAPFRNRCIYSKKNEDIYKASIYELCNSILIASYLGANSVIVHPIPSHCPANENFLDALPVLKESYLFLTEYAQKYDVVVAIENLLEGFMIHITGWLLDEITDLMFCLDTGHANVSGFWDRSLMHYGKKLVALHCNDNHGVTDEHLWPGHGTLDTERMYQMIHDSGYSGIWGLECRVEISDKADAIARYSDLLEEFSSFVFDARRISEKQSVLVKSS